MSDIDERLEEEILHASRKSFDSQESGINANFLTDVQSEITRLRAENEKLKEACQTIKVMFETKWSWSSSHKVDLAKVMLNDVLGGDSATQAPAPCEEKESGQQAVSSGEEASDKDAEITRLRAENRLLETVVLDTAGELGVKPDNEEIIVAIERLRAENEKLRAAFTASSSQVILDNSNDGDGPKPKNIAERLKDYAQHEAFYMRETLEEAADEIEKLRAALKPCVDYFSWNGGLIRDEEYEAAAAAIRSGK